MFLKPVKGNFPEREETVALNERRALIRKEATKNFIAEFYYVQTVEQEITIKMVVKKNGGSIKEFRIEGNHVVVEKLVKDYGEKYLSRVFSSGLSLLSEENCYGRSTSHSEIVVSHDQVEFLRELLGKTCENSEIRALKEILRSAE